MSNKTRDGKIFYQQQIGKLKMKIILSVLILFYVSACYAQGEYKINTPEDLNESCKKKSIEYFAEKNKKPQDWSSMWKVEGNVMDVKGRWKVDGVEYVVMCRIKQGLNESMALISINEVKNHEVKKKK